MVRFENLRCLSCLHAARPDLPMYCLLCLLHVDLSIHTKHASIHPSTRARFFSCLVFRYVSNICACLDSSSTAEFDNDHAAQPHVAAAAAAAAAPAAAPSSVLPAPHFRPAPSPPRTPLPLHSTATSGMCSEGRVSATPSLTSGTASTRCLWLSSRRARPTARTR